MLVVVDVAALVAVALVHVGDAVADEQAVEG